MWKTSHLFCGKIKQRRLMNFSELKAKLSKSASSIFGGTEESQSKLISSESDSLRATGFEYLKSHDYYFDAACQSLRPQPVIDSLVEYYTEYNSCGERVKYAWGQKTDQKVAETREKVLKFLKFKSKDYFVSFTLNTTYGLNLLLSQFNFKQANIKTIVTSDIEHNSVFLSTLSVSQTAKIERIVLTRDNDGSVQVSEIPDNSIVVMNAMSNFNGAKLNLKEVSEYVHSRNGFIIVDAAQAMAHNSELLHNIEPDAICFSAHKMYSASLGVIVMKKSFAKLFDTTFIGGGMVDDVKKSSYLLSADNPDHLHTKFEPGLQAWGEIIALGHSLDWLNSLEKSDHDRLENNINMLYDFLKNHPKIHLLNQSPASTMSFYVEGLDSHLLGESLSDQGIMVRTGYFCVHYYLSEIKKYPPLLRISLGFHNSTANVAHLIKVLSKI